jgi:hypothetical protein
MSEQQGMLSAWSMTLAAVLNGLLMVCYRMSLAGEEDKIVEVLEKDMRDFMRSYTPEQRQVMVLMLARLSKLCGKS